MTVFLLNQTVNLSHGSGEMTLNFTIIKPYVISFNVSNNILLRNQTHGKYIYFIFEHAAVNFLYEKGQLAMRNVRYLFCGRVFYSTKF